MKHNLVLIGMPGAGKSTVGVVLAKILGYRFIDSDLLIQEKTGQLLHEIITERGTEGFLALEDEVNASLETNHSVIATGGSVIYGSKAMEHLKKIGYVVYLKLSLESIAHRLGNLDERGVALREGQNLEDLYEERICYYEKYADIVIEAENKGIREITQEIAKIYKKKKG